MQKPVGDLRAVEAPAGWPRLGEATRVWLRIGVLSFGGPAGQIALMHRVLVEERRWISDRRFLHALNYCMLLPGPEAQQLATYIGWLLHGTVGGLIAGTLFVLPGAAVMLGLSIAYALWGELGLVAGLLFGLKAAVLAIVVGAVVRLGRRALRTRFHVGLALAAFAALVLGLSFPLVILAAGILGLLLPVAAAGHHAAAAAAGPGPAPVLGDNPGDGVAPARSALRVAGLLLAAWLLPVAAIVLVLGGDDVFARIAVFFSELAMLSFGGAYAVLAWVAQAAVETYGWLTPDEMVDGLGLAETTPGPLILTLQFVGFLAAFREPGGLDPLLAGALGGLLASFVTFAPCFLWIFLGAPFIERLRENPALNRALSAVTAAVVGVIASLALWFGLHTLFAEVLAVPVLGVTLDLPVPGSLDLGALVLAVAAAVALIRFRAPVLLVIAVSALTGVGVALLRSGA